MSGWLEQFPTACRKDVVALVRRRNEIEERKADALEQIATNLLPRTLTVTSSVIPPEEADRG